MIIRSLILSAIFFLSATDWEYFYAPLDQYRNTMPTEQHRTD